MAAIGLWGRTPYFNINSFTIKYDGSDAFTVDSNGITLGSSIDLNLDSGITVVPGSDTDVDLITVSVTGTPTISWDESEDAFSCNKLLSTGAGIIIGDSGDATKAVTFDTSGATTAKTATITSSHTDDRTITLPDASDTLVGKATTDTLTNKTIDANGTGNSISNIDVEDLANGTDGELITWDSDGAPATVSAGTSGQVLTSNGAGAAPTFQDAAGGGGGVYTLISSTETTSGASVTITGIDSTYDDYIIELHGVKNDAGSDYLQLQIGYGETPTIDTGTSYIFVADGYKLSNGGTGSATDFKNSGTTTINLSSQLHPYLAASAGWNGQLIIRDSQNTSTNRMIIGDVSADSENDGSGYLESNHITGIWTDNSNAITAVHFKWGSGSDFSAGTIKLIGIAKS